jgi:hypothetical protein
MVVYCFLAPCGLLVVFQRFGGKTASISSGLNMEAICSSETLVNSQNMTRRNPKDNYLSSHHRENLKSYMKILVPLKAVFLDLLSNY